MRSLPDAADLLKTARDGLLNDILPHLPKAHHYTALMAANALAISLREITADGARARAEAALHDSLYEAGEGAQDIDAFSARLAGDLRAGRFDARLPAVGQLLLDEVVARLRISNPKYVKQAGL